MLSLQVKSNILSHWTVDIIIYRRLKSRRGRKRVINKVTRIDCPIIAKYQYGVAF